MSVSENFDRKFNKSMRGYNTEEVDAALDALLRYCDELEDANREFEIANNDLIDDKTELNKKLEALSSDNEALRKRIAEISENLTRIEGVYNGYREKFGEARDLVTSAKSSAAEIIARANAKAEIITEESAKKRENMLSDLDKEIEKRQALIEKLDISYNKFNSALKSELEDMLAKVDSFNVMPILPDGLPERKQAEKIHTEDAVFTDAQTVFEPEPAQASEESAPVTASKDNDTAEQVQAGAISEKEAPEEQIQAKEEIILLGPVWRESTSNVGASEVSKIRNSLEAINRKVLEKKSTPHI